MATVISDSMVLISQPVRPCIKKSAIMTKEIKLIGYWRVCK